MASQYQVSYRHTSTMPLVCSKDYYFPVVAPRYRADGGSWGSPSPSGITMSGRKIAPWPFQQAEAEKESQRPAGLGGTRTWLEGWPPASSLSSLQPYVQLRPGPEVTAQSHQSSLHGPFGTLTVLSEGASPELPTTCIPRDSGC